MGEGMYHLRQLRLAPPIAALLLLVSAPLPAAAGEVQLDGKWVLTANPSGPVSESYMVFNPAGQVEIGSHRGLLATCPYQATQYSITLECEVEGKTEKLVMLVQAEFEQLIDPQGATYSKQ